MWQHYLITREVFWSKASGCKYLLHLLFVNTLVLVSTNVVQIWPALEKNQRAGIIVAISTKDRLK